MDRRRLYLRIGAICLGLLFGVQDVVAQAPRYRRSGPKVKVKVRKTERTRGIEQNKDAKSEVVPQLSADEFLNIQGKVKFIRAQQIKEYQLLIEDTDDDDAELPLLLFQLAEIYAQQQRYWRFRAFELYEKIDKAKGKAKKNELKAKQKKYFKAEKHYLTQAISAYAKIANNPKFKNFPRMDEVLFFYAFTLRNAKRLDLARKVFHQLITEHPKSKFVPEAYLAFADYFFEQNELDNALKFYNKVLEFPKTKVYAYAMYKKGWVFLNKKEFQDALETFNAVANKTKGNKSQAVINKASKKDLVRAYAEIGRAEKAYKFFQRVDKGYAFNMLKILGSIYLDQGKAKKTIYTHREMIKLKSKAPEVCEWQYNILQATMTIGDKTDQATELERLVKLYIAYRDRKILTGTPLDECRDNAMFTTSELAKLWHQEAIKTLNHETLGHAERLYKAYVKNFPKAEDIGEMEYYYAELLWQRAEGEEEQRMATERWERAAAAFTDVVKRDKVSAKLKKESAYAAVLGWKNALAVDPRFDKEEITDADPEGGDPNKVPEPKPIKERQQKMLDAFDIYLTYVKDPDDDERVVMKFLKARTYWRHYHFDKSTPLFEDIVENHLDHPAGHDAAVILINSLITVGDFDRVDKWAGYLLAKKDFIEDKDDLKNELMGLKAVSARRGAEQLEKEGNWIACGNKYLEIYNTSPNAKKMDEVLYNAGVCYETGKSIGLAIQAFAKLSERYPDSPHTQRALFRMGRNYAAIAFYRQAAEKFEEFAKKYGGEKEAAAALNDAVIYRKGIGDDEKAIKNTELFVKAYRKKEPQKAADAFFSIVGIYEKQKDYEKARKHLERYIREFGKAGGRDRVIVAHAKIGQYLWDTSCKVSGVDGACVSVKRERATRRRKRRRRGTELPTQCGPESKIKLKVVDRDARVVKAAQKHFKQAAAEFRKFKPDSIKGAGKDFRVAQAVYWYAASAFYLVETDYENFLSITFPKGLDFDPRNKKKAEKSKKRFLEWITSKQKTAGKVIKAYEQVRDIKGGGIAWRIAGAARIGQVSQNFADGLYTAEVPRQVRTGPYAEDGWNAYCDALTEQAEPLENLSVNAFSYCLETSTSLSWFNRWSKLCERELGQIRPGEYPTASELHGVAEGAAAITDTQGLISELKE